MDMELECQENGLMAKEKEGSEDKAQVRENWTNKFDFLVACVGGSVGLGNVWRFPYLCYRNGGGAFLIPYFFFLILGSLPLVILEVTIGQFMSGGGMKAWNMIPLFQGIGMTTSVLVFVVHSYYNVVLAWSLMYIFHSFSSPLPWDSCDGWWNTQSCTTNFTQATNRSILNTTTTTTATTTTTVTPITDAFAKTSYSSNQSDESIFSNLKAAAMRDPVTEFWERKVLGLSSGIHEMGTIKWDLALCLLLAWVIVYLCICKGVRSSGKVMYFTAPAPYVFMIIILIRNATLPGSSDGVRYYLTPNITKLSEFTVWADACKQTFFSSALCINILVTIGSYNKFKQNSCRDSVIFAFINAFSSIFAGFLVFTILGFMAHQQGRPIHEVAESGPGLAFIAYPKAVAQMPLSQFWSVFFFLMILFLGLDSQFLGVEAVVTSVMDQFPTVLRRGHRKKIVVGVISTSMFFVGLSLVSDGGMYALQLLDFACSGRTLMVLGTLESVAIAYFYGIHRFLDNIQMMVGSKWARLVSPYLTICLCVTTPISCLSVLVMSTMDNKELSYSRPDQELYYYPTWAVVIGWVLIAFTVVWIPAVAIYYPVKFGFTKEVWRRMLVPYSLEPHQMRPQDRTEKRLSHLAAEQNII